MLQSDHMREPTRNPEIQDLKAKALAEQVFKLIDELTRKIARDGNAVSRDGLMRQTIGQVEKIRKFVVGKDRSRLTPDAAHRIKGEYMMRAGQLEEAVLESEIAEAPVTGELATIKQACMPIPPNTILELQPRVSRQLEKLHTIDVARKIKTDPAWTVFFYEAAMKHASLPDFNADEWYGEVMIQRSPLMRKLMLPLVGYDMVERAAKEGARPMPDEDKYMIDRHRAMNALDELIELWEVEMPAVADKYRAVKDVLDQEVLTLSLYHRYQAQV